MTSPLPSPDHSWMVCDKATFAEHVAEHAATDVQEDCTCPSCVHYTQIREALQRLIYTFETTDLGDNLAITTRDSYALVDAILAAGFRRSVVSTPDVRALLEKARKAQRAVYLATDASVADDLSGIISGLADALEASVVSSPSDEVKVAAERAVHRHLSRLSKSDDWAEDDTAVGGHAAFIVDVLTEEGLLASAVSAPPTITDEMRDRAARAVSDIESPTAFDPEAFWVDESVRELRKAQAYAMADTVLRAALGGEEQQ